MMLSIMPALTVQAALGSQNYAFEDTSVRRSGGNNYLKDVNFDYGFTSLDFTYGTDETGTVVLNVKLDSPTGKNIATFESAPADRVGYTGWTKRTDRISITEAASGVHNVYFCVSSGELQMVSASFYYFDGSTELYKAYGETPASDKLAGTDNLHKINFLASLGIMDVSSETFDPAVPVSRIKFLKALSGFYNLDELPEVPVGIFVDIKEKEDRQIAYFLYLKGAIVLEDTAYLKPYEYIKPQEAAEYAANMLGYPNDMRVVSKLKAGKTHEDGYIRPAQMADILYNAAFHDYRVGYKTQSGALWYEEYDSYFLNYTKGYEVGEGLVSATSYTGVSSAADVVGEYQVRINDIVYGIGDTNADELLGVYSYYVYETDDRGIETIKAIAPKYPEYIEELDSSLEFTEISTRKVRYVTEKGKTEEIKLHAGTNVIYNGKALDVDIESVITVPANFRGRLVAVDNNRDKLCDTLIVLNARTMVLSGVSEMSISDLISGTVVDFGAENRAEFVRFGRIANAVDFNKLDTVDVYESASLVGTKLYRIVYSPNSIETTLTGVGGDDELTFEDGTKAKLSPYAKAPYATTPYVPSVGDIGTFFINSFGEVVYYKTVMESELSIGWLYKIILNDEDELAFATLKTTANEIIKYQFAERVFVEGVRVKNYDELKTGKSAQTTVLSSKAGIDLDEPIVYRLNADGMIDVLDTLNQINTPITNYDSIKEILAEGTYRFANPGFYRNTAINGKQYYETLDGFLAVTDSDTYAFNKSSIDKEYDSFEKKNRYSDDSKTYAGYTVGAEDSVTLDIVKFINDSKGTGIVPFVVQTKEQYVNAKGEVAYKLTGLSPTGAVSYVLSASAYSIDPDFKNCVDAVLPGDLVSGGKDGMSGELKTLQLLHFGDNDFVDVAKSSRTVNGQTVQPVLRYIPNIVKADEEANDNWGYGEVDRTTLWQNHVVAGTITAFGDDYFELTRINTGQTQKITHSTIKVTTVGDRGLDIDASGTSSMLTVGQKVIGFFDYYKPSTFYIYENMN